MSFDVNTNLAWILKVRPEGVEHIGSITLGLGPYTHDR